jgi:multidrug efflux pump subunit AcrA (membrane-fusion protein)
MEDDMFTYTRRFTKSLALILSLALFLSACSGFGQPATPTPASQSAEPAASLVSATGVVVPETWASLSLPTGGNLVELLVQEGDIVEAGQVLLRLDGSESLQAELTTAGEQLLTAEQNLDSLYEDVDLRLGEVSQVVSLAQQEVIAAERALDPFNEQRYEDDLDRARDEIVTAQDKLDQAREDFEPYADWDVDNATRKSYEDKLEDAQQVYDEAVRKVTRWRWIGAGRGGFANRKARLAKAQLDYENLSTGPDPDELAQAQAALASAQARQAAAEAALADLELLAPFGGTVSRVYYRLNEWVVPGDALLILADLTSLRVETTDLNEIDVARLQVGDRASLTFDALPDVVVSGEIVRIANRASEGSGVNYTVVVELSETPERLLWGMTAFVDVDVSDQR